MIYSFVCMLCYIFAYFDCFALCMASWEREHETPVTSLFHLTLICLPCCWNSLCQFLPSFSLSRRVGPANMQPKYLSLSLSLLVGIMLWCAVGGGEKQSLGSMSFLVKRASNDMHWYLCHSAHLSSALSLDTGSLGQALAQHSFN